ncbi:hypothetical protein V5F40_22690 [Xanthobacter sp. DSM 14520]|uniref:Flp family type IVb pilin n=1 Tax=Xanthobacter autotrophicus (strain ATCC BAA-1158 / Py2) TaxID=78245 RepID=UPI00372AC4E3
MKKAVSKARDVLRDESGASIVEYGVLTLGIIGVATAATTALGTSVTSLMTRISGAITAANP